MSFTSKLKVTEKNNFETERALIVRVTNSTNPKFDRFYTEDEEGNRTRIFINEGEEAPADAIRVVCVGVTLRPQVGTEPTGDPIFAEEQVQAFVPKTAFKNWIENVQTQSYKGHIGAVAVIEGAVAESKHDVGNLKVGDAYGVITSITYTSDNRDIAMALIASNGGSFKF